MNISNLLTLVATKLFQLQLQVVGYGYEIRVRSGYEMCLSIPPLPLSSPSSCFCRYSVVRGNPFSHARKFGWKDRDDNSWFASLWRDIQLYFSSVLFEVYPRSCHSQRSLKAQISKHFGSEDIIDWKQKINSFLSKNHKATFYDYI